MKIKIFTPILLCFLILSGTLLSSCFWQKPITLIYNDFDSMIQMNISKAGGSTHEILDEELKASIYNKFKVVEVQKKKKDNAILSPVPDQGTPEYYIHIQFKDENDNTVSYSFSINVKYDYWGNIAEAYYLQRRQSSQTVYFTESDEEMFNYFKTLYDNHTP